MKKDWMVVVVSTLLTAVIALGVIRWMAPQLLGFRSDQLVVKASKSVPPFFENVFRFEDSSSLEMVINDPYTKIRGNPFYPDEIGFGPNDMLGFRNHQIPNQADIITIGDSQTYGNNAPLEQNWPSTFYRALELPPIFRHYSMAVGGWGAAQYYYAFMKSTYFNPRAVVVAFYTGNDPMESFSLAYSVDIYRNFRPNPKLKLSDAPKGIPFPSPPEYNWPVTFQDGYTTVFTPKLRHYSNQEHPAVDAGYEIMAQVAEAIAQVASKRKIQLIFTIIPTKERVYEARIAQENLQPTTYYQELIRDETKRTNELAKRLGDISGAKYVDVITPLQQAALEANAALYPSDSNGHPIAQGYAVIGQTIAQATKSMLTIPKELLGVWAIKMANDQVHFQLINREGRWNFPSPKLFAKNGWDLNQEIDVLTLEQVAHIPLRGTITEVNPERFGPVAQ